MDDPLVQIAQESDLAPLFGDLSKSLSEIKPPLEAILSRLRSSLLKTVFVKTCM